MSEYTCPNCDASGMEVFYQAKRIPVHSCMMLAHAEDAIHYPTRDLDLAFCHTCGFISNVLFDASVQNYTSGYEEQQSFSARFRAFQTDLIARLIERYDLRGKDVVEIGCGKGDFLLELCEAGNSRGVGIDPACDPGRIHGRGDGRVRFIAEYYSKRHAQLPCDLLCCRHTLEHIHITSDFIRRVRDVVGGRENRIVFFEVPAVERVLREAAFWDIYYEHCSYFSLGSLARVFRANRFEVAELGTEYDGQYLVIAARPAEEQTEAAFPLEDDVLRTAKAVATFRSRVRETVDGWRSRLRATCEDGKRIAIWGSGSKCVSFLSALGIAEQVCAIVDINPYRHGKYLAGSGKRVVPPDALKGLRPGAVVIMNPIYREEIQRDLDTMDVKAEILSV